MLRLFGRYTKNHIPALLVNFLFLGIQVFIQTNFILREMKTILDSGVAAGNMDLIVRSCTKMAFFTVLAVLCTAVTSYMSARVVAGFVGEVREDCIRKIYSLSPQDLLRFGSSSLVTRIMSDMLQVQLLLINLCRSSMMAAFVVIGMLILIFMISPTLGTVVLIAVSAAAVFMTRRGLRVQRSFGRIEKLTERMNLLFREKLVGARTIRAFRNETMEEEKMAAANADLFEAYIEVNKPTNYLTPITLIIMNWAVIAVYLIGAAQLQRGLVSVSDLLLIFNYIAYFITALTVVPVLAGLFPKVTVASSRIMELLDTTPAQETGTEASGITEGGIEFKDVTFGYSGTAQVLSHISFRAEAGKTTAIIGATGSGKTTLMNLLQGLYRTTDGDILIDGVSIRRMDPAYLRRNISYATQKLQIFQDTMRANITAYDDSISEDRIRQALEASYCDEVVNRKPGGLDFQIAQNGMNITGGQKQRLSLARAFAKDAAIYVFDDALSALDAHTEQKVRSGMRTMLAGRTVLLVSQKISTVRDADQIIVLDNGSVVGAGIHESLLNACREYQEIYRIQCCGEEEPDGKE